MKHKVLVASGIVLGVLALLVILAWPLAPLWVRLGAKPVCIQGDLAHLEIVSCPGTGTGSQDTAAIALPTSEGQGPIPLIVDDDGSPDGVIALLFFLRNPRYRVEAVTVSQGEAHPEIFAGHIARLLAALGRSDIPVGVGRANPLAGDNRFPEPWRRASDAFWGVALPDAPAAAQTVPAAALIVDRLKQSAQPVAVFVSGPHTNLAEALRLDPGIKEHVGEVYIMGGSVYVPGNIQSDWPAIHNRVAEWNIWADPAAADEVFTSGLPLHIMPLDGTGRVTWTRPDADSWASAGTPEGRLAAGVLNWMLTSWSTNNAYIWDLAAAAGLTDARLCPQVPVALDVTTEDGPAQGRTAIVTGPANAEVCLQPDVQQVKARAAGVLSRKETGMPASYPSEAKTQGEQSTVTPPVGADERIARVENGLVLMSANGQPQWGSAAALTERMAYYQAPGVSIAVIDDYRLAWAKGYGVRVAGQDQPVTTQTLFHAASVAKSLSAAATLTLIEQGLLSLDEDVNQRLVSWRVPENAYTAVEKVTLRRLLSHSAGLKDGLTDRGPGDPMPAFVTFGDVVPAATLQQLLAGMPEDGIEPTRVTGVPGTAYRYTNADYAILELLVQDRLDRPFEDFMQTTVLDRLGMASSSYRQPLPPALRSRSASEHTLDGKPVPGGRANFPFHAAGSLWTTPGDLTRFMIDLMKAYQGETGHLLSPQMARQMLSPQIAIPNSPLSDAYGLGVELQSTGQGPKVWHSGGTWGSCSIIWFYPQLGKGAVVMINGASGSLLRYELLLGIAAAYGWPTG